MGAAPFLSRYKDFIFGCMHTNYANLIFKKMTVISSVLWSRQKRLNIILTGLYSLISLLKFGDVLTSRIHFQFIKNY